MKPFLADRPSAAIPSLRPVVRPLEVLSATAGGASVASSGGLHPPHAHPAASASVECIREGDRVVRLVVTCACGERIEVECLYPVGG
ncbi:MAG: hypothetical protein ACK5CF_04250 [Opitutaceae bacterium]|jgi:hypothetical protein